MIPTTGRTGFLKGRGRAPIDPLVHLSRRRLLAAALVLAPAALLPLAGPAASASTTPSLTVGGLPLANATVRAGSTVTAAVATGTRQVKWVLDGSYVGSDTTAPFTTALSVGSGAHRLRARAYDAAGTEVRVEVPFTVGATTAPVPAPTPTPTSTGGTTVTVTSSTGLAAALASAAPGTHVELADGRYSTAKGFVVSTACTSAKPCTLHGGRGAVLDGNGTSGVYGLHLSRAAYWTVSGLTVANAAKGVVLDHTQHSTLTGLEVRGTGDEGIHLRALSSDNTVRGNVVHDTGKRSPGYGEGIYVGSAKSNWGTYSGGAPDRSDRNVIDANTISATTAESVDVKEGTTDGTLSGNSFDGAGMSGTNYADSWVDLKGNGWVVSGNRGVNALLDGFQTHVAVTGWGKWNLFRANVADTRSRGYGFRVQDPGATGNRVACDNRAGSAGAGLANLACS